MAGEDLHLTYRGLKLLRIFIEDVRAEHAGADLMDRAHISSGSLYPLLIRFEQLGLLESRWEEGDPATLGRPLRRFYRITSQGAEVAFRALSELSLPANLVRRWKRA
jgi:PadR family transcriptional regulator PadR